MRCLSLTLAAMAAMALAGCETYTQTTSGKEYLARYARHAGDDAESRIDPAVQAAAAVEPALTFPARIGIARIDRGALSPIPRREAEAWMALAQELGPDWGTFVPISLLITALAGDADSDKEPRKWGCHYYDDCLEQTIREIRLGAARQHVDVVLIYEVHASGESTSNALAVTKFAIVGFFFVPSEDIVADGFAQAVLVDVRNGYSYGFASATADEAASALSTSVNQSTEMRSTLELAKTEAALMLVPEVKEMATRLRIDLAEKRAADAASAGAD